MSDLKRTLIALGHTHKELRDPIRKILASHFDPDGASLPLKATPSIHQVYALQDKVEDLIKVVTKIDTVLGKASQMDDDLVTMALEKHQKGLIQGIDKLEQDIKDLKKSLADMSTFFKSF
jgi:uncharacterized coiled-coil DUF342 family protein